MLVDKGLHGRFPRWSYPLEHNTLTAAVKCPSLTILRHCFMFGSTSSSFSPVCCAPPPCETSSPVGRSDVTKSSKPEPLETFEEILSLVINALKALLSSGLEEEPSFGTDAE
ncbi:hypothetical protein M8C21_007179 [Ambrosia artemisiifolia]|uniref:Uncharacterized protein n=1 Tax=Ambrosia artemisiifolia TaxID=4212 RepID=A0AAD5BZA7_AMBAR|nr:hypothetical protein M8C21_007179 [Ambrosia artemisiifolia]